MRSLPWARNNSKARLDLWDDRLSATTICPGHSAGANSSDIGLDAVIVHSTIQNPGSDQPVTGKARDEGLGVQVAEGRMVDQEHPDWSPARGLDEVGIEARLVDKNQPFQHVGYVMLPGFVPDPARLGHVGPQDFANQLFFIVTDAKPMQPSRRLHRAYNFGRRLKTLRGLTPYEFIVKCWTSGPKKIQP